MIELEINTLDKTLSMFNRTLKKSKMIMHTNFEQIGEDAEFVIFDNILFIDKNNVKIKFES